LTQNKIIDNDVKLILQDLDLIWFAGKKILITGASGMIGFYLLKCFEYLMNNQQGPRELWAISRSGEYPEMLFLNDKIKLKQMDLCDSYAINSLPLFDGILHAGGYAQPSVFLKNPLSTIAVNTNATMSLIHRLNSTGKFLFFSSSEVYSGSNKFPYKESDIGTTNTLHPRASYIEGKRCGEAIINSSRDQLNLDALSIRLSLVYGPGTKKNDKRVLNSIIDQSIGSGRIKLLDSGSAVRTYCYITDAIRMSLIVMTKGVNPIYNIGGNSEVTIRQLAEKIATITKSKLEIGKEDKPLEGAPLRVQLDLTKTLDLFGTNNFIGIDEGLFRTVEWNKERLRNE
jgi:nucleoside-diphosphate-sugar epimerase